MVEAADEAFDACAFPAKGRPRTEHPSPVRAGGDDEAPKSSTILENMGTRDSQSSTLAQGWVVPTQTSGVVSSVPRASGSALGCQGGPLFPCWAGVGGLAKPYIRRWAHILPAHGVIRILTQAKLMVAHRGLLDPAGVRASGAWTVLTLQTELSPPRPIPLAGYWTLSFLTLDSSPRLYSDVEVTGLSNLWTTTRRGLEPVEKHHEHGVSIGGEDTCNTLTAAAQHAEEALGPDWGGNIKGVSSTSTSRKSTRLARCSNASVLERAKLRKAHLREGTIEECRSPVPGKASGSSRYPGPTAIEFNKIKLKGAKCGITLNDEEVRSLKAFWSASA